MGEGTRSRGLTHRLSGWVPDVVVVICLALSASQVFFNLGGRIGLVADPASEPAQVRPPDGVHVPAQPVAQAVAPVAAAVPDAARVRRAVAGALVQKNLGKRVRALVTDLDGHVLFSRGSGAITPASNTKLVSTLAALDAMGPDQRFQTTVRRVAGSNVITLVGGGDPYLGDAAAEPGGYPARASLAQLAARTAARLRTAGVSTVRLRYDDSLFSGPAFNPRWPASYRPDGVVPPISALWVDQGHDPDGHGYRDNPAAGAAAAFAAQLRRVGVGVRGPISRRVATSGDSAIAHVQSAPLAQIVQRIVSVSDNNAAEVVLRHLALADSDTGSFTAGAAAVTKRLRALGVNLEGVRLYDGSGLSRDNRLSTRTLVDVLRVAAKASRPDLRAVINGLSVAGFEGSLADRFDRTDPRALGRVAAKTGTLTGVHGLAGIATDVSGAPMVFAVMTDQVPLPRTLSARLQLDRFAAALGACHCAG